MKIYNVYHCYDVDSGYGDAVEKEMLVATFESEMDAKAFVEKYSDPYVYRKPYDELYCNQYIVRKTELVTHAEFDIDNTPNYYGIFIPKRDV
jgi:hypothetical protein